MSEELNNILYRMKENRNVNAEQPYLDFHESGILLDYIEQLQQENEGLKSNWNELESWLEEIVNNDAYSPYDGWSYEEVIDKIHELKDNLT